jgi:Peptidase family S41
MSMAEATLEQRVEWLQSSLREIGLMCLRLSGKGVEAASATGRQNGGQAHEQPAKSASPDAASGAAQVPAAAVSLSQFLAGVQDLTLAERQQVVDAAIAMLSQVFVHLPLKRAMHGIDPVQRLRLLQRRLGEDSQSPGPQPPASARGFHDEMIDIFHSLRDLHTNYILPASYQGRVAFLPFQMEEYFDGVSKERHYIVTKVLPGFVHPTFKAGVTVSHWNGIEIDRAVELNAAREAGSNLDARHARGLEALTLRPMALSSSPDEEWVIIGYQTEAGEALELRFDWKVTAPPPPGAFAAVETARLADGNSRVMGFDAVTEAVNRAKKSLFFPSAIQIERRMAAVMAQSASGQTAAGATSYGNIASAQQGMSLAAAAASLEAPAGAGADTTSLMPNIFSFRKVTTPHGEFGYVRIFSFMANDANALVVEFARIAALLPQNGLIIDVRGNGGGNILAGEQLLQLFTSQQIETERFHFINTPTTLQLCRSDPSLGDWEPSINLSLSTAEQYSQGFPLTPASVANSVGRKYPGKVVLVIDALCYSTTDIFTAGFRDHKIGAIIGTNGHTGAGGANVWTYDFFTGLPDFKTLPKGVNFRTAIRRSTRVGANVGMPLEDLGVEPDFIHFMTRQDILDGNSDLITEAARVLVNS